MLMCADLPAKSDPTLPTVDLVAMPEPGDPRRGFLAEPGRCWQMICDKHTSPTTKPDWRGKRSRVQVKAARPRKADNIKMMGQLGLFG